MRAVDTNILVYAAAKKSPQHALARTLVESLAEGDEPWALPWPCVYEFLRIVTHPHIYKPPVPMSAARADLMALLGSPSLILLSETPRHAAILEVVLEDSGATNNLVYDAHIVALCREHGVAELITADRDFLRFSGIRVINPFARR